MVKIKPIATTPAAAGNELVVRAHFFTKTTLSLLALIEQITFNLPRVGWT